MKNERRRLAAALAAAVMLAAGMDCGGKAYRLKGLHSFVRPASALAEEASPDFIRNLDETQRNSISMLNYLAVLTQAIGEAQDSRLYLEEVYSLLINNTYPNAVDHTTLSQLSNILDTLETYRMASVKRERLQYQYEQNQAQEMLALLPNPLRILNVVNAANLPKLAAAVADAAAGSVVNHMAFMEESDLQYLQDGWNLDDEEAAALHNSRKDTFSYMVQIVSEYDLPGELALSEQAVQEFVKWQNNENVVQRIQFLEANQEVYQAMGAYWLVLAQSYYENGQYAECLRAEEAYEALDIQIFRKDYQFAKLLPLVIIAAEEVLPEADYVKTAEHDLDLIMTHTDYGDWALRYFAAQTYANLFDRTRDRAYLEKAYTVVLDNVNSLVNIQKEMNEAYLAEFVPVEAAKEATKQQKKDIKKYNDLMKEERKTALPPIYEPLVLNCELLFMLADELHLPEKDRTQIESILHQDGTPIFLNAGLDQRFWFKRKARNAPDDILFDKEEIVLPVEMMTERSQISVTIQAPDAESVVIEDWAIDKVERGEQGDFSAFRVKYESKTAKKYKYVPDSDITIEIREEEKAKPIVFKYTTAAVKKLKVVDAVEMIRVEE